MLTLQLMTCLADFYLKVWAGLTKSLATGPAMVDTVSHSKPFKDKASYDLWMVNTVSHSKPFKDKASYDLSMVNTVSHSKPFKDKASYDLWMVNTASQSKPLKDYTPCGYGVCKDLGWFGIFFYLDKISKRSSIVSSYRKSHNPFQINQLKLTYWV